MSPEIQLIQQGLRGLAHDPGPVDGVFGPSTRAAAERWLAAGGKSAAPATSPPTTGLVIYQGSAGYPVTEIVVHCSATKPEWLGSVTGAQVREIRRWHVEGNGWKDIGYHWVIGRDGANVAGRPQTQIGAGVVGHNQGVIHICLIGGFGSAATDRFDEHFTRAQDASLSQQIAGICARTRITRISGHNEWAAKACPGFHVPTWLKEAA